MLFIEPRGSRAVFLDSVTPDDLEVLPM